MKNEFIIVNPKLEKHIALIQLNRPNEMNALNNQLMGELKQALIELDDNNDVRVIILTGNEKAFAAGADIKEMADKSFNDMVSTDHLGDWDQLKNTKKPTIAAVSGFALGGGCEVCMMCDMIIASDTAKFGQPEIKLGVIPGAGGTQRLTYAAGKALAMELILTGRLISANEALNMGLINKIIPNGLYMQEAVNLAKEIAAMSPVAARIAKESVLKAFNSALDEGLQFERSNFYAIFDSKDQKEGMKAFIEKRKPEFTGN